MSAHQKENVFIKLRDYHLNTFPDKMSSSLMEQSKIDFQIIEDKIINMLLNLVNGKGLYVDFVPELKSFEVEMTAKKSDDPIEFENRTLFTTKIRNLREVLKFALDADFKMRTPRFTKESK